MSLTAQTTRTAAEEPFRRQIRPDVPLPTGTSKQTPRMVRLTVNLPSDLVEQMRDAVYWTPGLTLAWMIARAARTSLAEMESTNQGPFPKRLKPLRAGRPRLVGQSMTLRPQSTGRNGNVAADGASRSHAATGPSVG